MKPQSRHETPGAIMRRCIAEGRPFPPMAGGEDALEVLKGIREELQKGGQTPEQLAQMTQDANAAQAALAASEAAKAAGDQSQETEAQELRRLRAEMHERTMRDQLQVVAAGAVERAQLEARSESQKMATMLEEEIGKAMRGESGSAAIMDVLKNTRAASRLAMPTASEQFAAQLSAGGGAAPGSEHSGIYTQEKSVVRAGDDQGVKEFYESKSLALFCGAIMRAKQGMARPFEIKALAESTSGSGGYLVPPEWMSDVLDLLRPATVVLAAGPRTVPIGSSLHSVALSAGGTAYWGTENSATPPSQETFTDTPLLAPHSLTALVPASNQLLRDTSRTGLEDAEKVIREDMVEIMSLALDLGFLQGSGSGGQPTGLINISGITDVTTSLGINVNGSFFDDDIARNMLASFRTFNIKNPRLAWFFNPILINELEGLKDNEGRYLLETRQLTVNADQRTGTLWGIPFYTTTQIPGNQTYGESSAATYVLLVDLNNLYIGESRELTLDSSSEASYTPDGGATWINAFQSRQTLFRTEWIGDIAHRRPGAGVVLCKGIRVA